MKQKSKILALTIAALFCFSSFAIPLGESNSASGDETVEIEPSTIADKLVEGNAWGMDFGTDYEELQPTINKIMKSLGYFDKTNPSYEGLKPEQVPTDLESYLEFNLLDMLKGVSPPIFNFEEMDVSIDFSIDAATLIEVITANDDGYVIDFSVGISVKAEVGLSVSGVMPADGKEIMIKDLLDGKIFDSTLEDNTVYVNLDLAAYIGIAGELKLNKAGGIIGLAADVDVAFDLGINTNLDIEALVTMIFAIKDSYGSVGKPSLPFLADMEKRLATVESVTFDYNNREYRIGLDLCLEVGVSFDESGLILIPLTLTEDFGEKTYKTTPTIDKISITGNIALSDDVKALIDFVFGEGYADSLLNYTIFGLPLLDDGKLLLNNYLNLFDLNQLLANVWAMFIGDGPRANGSDSLMALLLGQASAPVIEYTITVEATTEEGTGVGAEDPEPLGFDIIVEFKGFDKGIEESGFLWEVFYASWIPADPYQDLMDYFAPAPAPILGEEGLSPEEMDALILKILKDNKVALEPLVKELALKELNADQISAIEDKLANLYETNDDGGEEDEGDDDNTMLYVAVGVAAIAIVAILAWFLLRKS